MARQEAGLLSAPGGRSAPASADSPATDHGFAELLAALESGWREATTAAEPRRRVVSIAGEGVAISVCGEHLAAEMHDPFAHLPEAEEATLELHCWDAEACGAPVPPSPFPLPEGDTEETRIRVGERILAAVNPEGGSVAAIHPDLPRGYYAVESADRLAGVERAVPLVTLLRLLLGSAERAVAHGAVVCRDGRGLLVPAMAGAGKSTLAVAALLEGLDLVADDISVIDAPAGRPPAPARSLRAHGLYCTAKLDEPALDRFPGLRERIVGRADHGLKGPKDVIDLSSAGPGRIRRECELVGLAVPRIDPEGPRVEAMPAVEAMLALAPTSVILFGTSREADSMAVMGELVRRLPRRRLLIGPDHGANARALAALLEELDG